MNKQKTLWLAVVIWAIAMTGYTIHDIWSDYKTNGIQVAYNTGKEDVIVELISQIQKNECHPIPVFIGENKIQIVNAECLSVKEKDNAESVEK